MMQRNDRSLSMKRRACEKEGILSVTQPLIQPGSDSPLKHASAEKRHPSFSLSLVPWTTRPFTARSPTYYASLIASQTPPLLGFLLHGTQSWLLKICRLVAVSIALLPASIQYAWYYVACDRVAVSYEDGGDATGRRYLDVYGSRTRLPNNHPSSQRASAQEANRTTGNGKERNPKKPVVIFLPGGAWIIGYKIWGVVLARALVPFGVLVIIPDYRNFPQVKIGDMVDDVDCSVQWVLDNCERFGGDPGKVVLVGQSAGAHLGSCVLIRKALCEVNTTSQSDENSSPTSYSVSQIKGFIPVSGPYNVVALQDHCHRHGLYGLISAVFGGALEEYSPTHMLLQFDDDTSQNQDGSAKGVELASHFPPVCVIHGTRDNTVPCTGATEFVSCLRDAGIRDVTTKMYAGWSHLDPIFEAPMDGDHTFHRDVYDLVKLWTGGDTLPPFDESLPIFRRICPHFLVMIVRILNPF